jgi:hypothetical protein
MPNIKEMAARVLADVDVGGRAAVTVVAAQDAKAADGG